MKKIIVLLTTLVLCFGLFACGADNEAISEGGTAEKAEDSDSPSEANKKYSMLNGYCVLRVAADADILISGGGETLTNIAGKENADTDFGSMYEIGYNEEIVMFTLSVDKVYNVEIDSFKSDIMDYAIRFFDSQNNLIEERSFNNLSVKEDMHIITDTNQKSTVLSIDMNGNGKIDKKIKPDKIEH